MSPTERAIALLQSNGQWSRTWQPIARYHAEQAGITLATVRGLAKDLRRAYGHRRAAVLVDWRNVAKTLLAQIGEDPASW